MTLSDFTQRRIRDIADRLELRHRSLGEWELDDVVNLGLNLLEHELTDEEAQA